MPSRSPYTKRHKLHLHSWFQSHKLCCIQNNTAWRFPENIKHRPPDSSPLICFRCLVFTVYEITKCFSLNHGSAKKKNNNNKKQHKIRHQPTWTVSRPDPGPARFDSPPPHQSRKRNVIKIWSQPLIRTHRYFRCVCVCVGERARPHAQVHLKWQYDERRRNNRNHPALFWSRVSSSHL